MIVGTFYLSGHISYTDMLCCSLILISTVSFYPVKSPLKQFVWLDVGTFFIKCTVYRFGSQHFQYVRDSRSLLKSTFDIDVIDSFTVSAQCTYMVVDRHVPWDSGKEVCDM
jgi:hypothetical protein